MFGLIYTFHFIKEIKDSMTVRSEGILYFQLYLSGAGSHLAFSFAS